MRTHDLKCWPEFFEPIRSGLKMFEIRKNDRGFQVGDLLRLREFDPNTETYSGRVAYRVVTYILIGKPFGIDPDYVVMSLGPDEP